MEAQLQPDGRGYGFELEGEEKKKAYAELGYGMTPEGGFAPETRVKKVNSQRGDVVDDGTEGTVKGGREFNKVIGDMICKYGYLVMWDGMPSNTINFVVDKKLQAVES